MWFTPNPDLKPCAAININISMKEELVRKAYEIAKERYSEIGVDTEKVIAQMQDSISACTAGRLTT